MAATRTLLLLAVFTALLSLPASAPQAGEPRLLVRDLVLKHPPRWVRPVTWQGEAAIFALSPAAEATHREPRPPFQLTLARLRGQALTVEARWPLPRELRWVEPIALGEGRQGLWALIGGGWYLGRVEGGEVAWRLMCRCESLFSAGKGLLPFKARFAVDLDGDGRDEVLLPHWRGLMVYGLAQGGEALLPLWRDSWEIGEHYELRDDRIKISLAVPRYVLKDADGDGIRDFIIIGSDALRVTRHPRPRPSANGPFYIPERDKLPELRRRNLPASLLRALETMRPATHASARAFRRALAKHAPEGAAAAWAPHLEAVLEALREPIPAYFPRPVPVPGLAPPGKKERYRILTVEDMNGDGALDLVHIKSSDEGELLDQKNQVRWYQGRRTAKGLAFHNEPSIFFSEGPAFAELVFPRNGGGGAPVLFLATTEVSLMAIIRAFTLGEVSLDLFVYPWREGKPVVPPPVSGSLVFEFRGKGKKNRPMVLLADLDGKGGREFLFNLDTDTLTAFPARAEGPDFEAEPLTTLEVALPKKPDTIFVRDFDGDGREELLLWYLREGAKSPLGRTLRVLQYGEAPPEAEEETSG